MLISYRGSKNLSMHCREQAGFVPFARLMQACLNEQIFQIFLVYLDDILIFSKTFEEHLERLKMVLKRLREHGLKLKLEKCTFLRRRVTYLGREVYEVSGADITPDPRR